MIRKVTIFKHGASYYVRYGYPQIRERCGTLEAAKKRQKDLLAGRVEPLPTPARRVETKLEKNIELFINEARAGNVSASHLRNLEWSFGKLKNFADKHGITAIEDFTRDNLAEFRLGLAGTSESKNHNLKRVRSFIRSRVFGEKREIMLSALKFIKKTEADEERLKPKPFTPTQIARLLYLANERQALFIRLCYQTGLSGIDAIHVTRKQVAGGILRTKRRKTKKPVEMRLSQDLYRDLMAYADKHEHHQFIFSPGQPPRTATLIIRAEIRSVMQAALLWDSTSGVLHRFRDSFVARCIEAGKLPKDVAALIGDNLDTMLRHYADLFEIGREERLEAPPFTFSSEASRLSP